MDIKLEQQIIVFDFSVIKQILEGKNEAKTSEIMEKLSKIKKESTDNRMVVMTTTSNFLRATYIAEKIEINMLKLFLDVTTIIPTFGDYKDENAVMDDIIKLVEKIDKVKHNVAG